MLDPAARPRLRLIRGVGRGAAVLALVLSGDAAGAADAWEEVADALVAWADGFNAGDGEAACAIFSDRLVAEFRGEPARGRGEVCRRLEAALADPARRYRYDLAVAGIEVSGDLAVVRLDRQLTVTPPGVTTTEPAIDVLVREPDGAWRIVRSLAFRAPEPGEGRR